MDRRVEVFRREAARIGRSLVRPVIEAILPMPEIRAGHERLQKDDSVGKLVMAW